MTVHTLIHHTRRHRVTFVIDGDEASIRYTARTMTTAAARAEYRRLLDAGYVADTATATRRSNPRAPRCGYRAA